MQSGQGLLPKYLIGATFLKWEEFILAHSGPTICGVTPSCEAVNVAHKQEQWIENKDIQIGI